jgi:hypothetical protein
MSSFMVRGAALVAARTLLRCAFLLCALALAHATAPPADAYTGFEPLDCVACAAGFFLIATVYPEVYPSDMPPILARLEPSHVYIRPH